jgi:hypothetical protein
MVDLSKKEGSLTFALEKLIPRMDSLDVSEIRMEFLKILVDESVKISNQTRSKWIDAINKASNKRSRMQVITNAYLAGSGLRVTS